VAKFSSTSSIWTTFLRPFRCHRHPQHGPATLQCNFLLHLRKKAYNACSMTARRSTLDWVLVFTTCRVSCATPLFQSSFLLHVVPPLRIPHESNQAIPAHPSPFLRLRLSPQILAWCPRSVTPHSTGPTMGHRKGVCSFTML
jgi:hypothetical protein